MNICLKRQAELLSELMRNGNSILGGIWMTGRWGNFAELLLILEPFQCLTQYQISQLGKSIINANSLLNPVMFTWIVGGCTIVLGSRNRTGKHMLPVEWCVHHGWWLKELSYMRESNYALDVFYVVPSQKMWIVCFNIVVSPISYGICS